MAEYLDKAAILRALDRFDKYVDEHDKPDDATPEKQFAGYARGLSSLMRKVIGDIPTVTPTLNVVQFPPWIKVEDALPKEDESVIVLTDDFLVWGAKYHKGSFYLDGQCWTETVTHWMKPPELPKEAADKLKEKQRMENGFDPDTGKINKWWWRTPTARKDESNG